MPIKSRFTRYAQLALELVENLGLMVIAIATVVAGYQEVMTMVGNARVRKTAREKHATRVNLKS